MHKKQIAGKLMIGLLAVLYMGCVQPAVIAAPVIANMPHKADGSRITGNQSVPQGMPGDVVVKTKTPAVQPAAKTEPAKPAVQTGQPVPKTEPVKSAVPAVQPVPKTEPVKPAVPAVQPVPKTEPVKPAVPAAKPVPKTEPAKSAVPAVQPVPKTEPAKPAVQTVQPVPKTEPMKPAVPAVQPVPKTEPVKPAVPAAKPVPKTEPVNPAVPAVKPVPKAKSVATGVAAAKLPTKPPGWETGKQKKEKEKEREKTPGKEKKQEQVKSVYQVGDKGWKIKQAQQYLLKLGFDPDETDGRFTKSTRKALRKFQKKYKLKETGNLDNVTYEELKFQVEAKEYGGNVATTKILKTAAQYKGVRYVFGGTTPSGFDCSGYVQYVFAKNGIRLTRTADTQALEGKYVSRKALKPGDLVFFTTYEPGASHVGIYAGNNKFWNATSSRGVMLSDLTDSYWGPRYYTARRILTGR